MVVEKLAQADDGMRFSYWEYQALMMCLAGTMCLGLVAIELTMRRFQVLPLLFPGMFSIRQRRLYFFDYDVDDVAIGKQLRSEAKVLVRIVLFVVLSYLWQHCVLETDQMIGNEFPIDQCDRQMDCFASEFHVATFFSRQYTPVDCLADKRVPFKGRVVVSCIAFVQPSATKWLMHLGIAHSITQLNFKSYEVLVWVTGNSRWVRRVICVLVFVSFAGTICIFFIGSITKFASSWLTVVTTLWIPIFLCTVWRTGRVLKLIWQRDAERVQSSIEEHLNLALADFKNGEGRDGAEGELSMDVLSRRRSSAGFMRNNPLAVHASACAKKVYKASGISSLLQAGTWSRRGLPPTPACEQHVLSQENPEAQVDAEAVAGAALDTGEASESIAV